MTLIRWNPWNMSSLLDEDWDLPTVPGLSKVMGQGLNIFETENSLIAEVALPGIPDDKIDISIDQKIVRISASNEQTQEEKDKRKYFMSSMASSYNYSFKLPDGIAADKEPEAVLDHGVLKLVFPKAEVIAPKKIKVVSQNSSKKEIETK